MPHDEYMKTEEGRRSQQAFQQWGDWVQGGGRAYGDAVPYRTGGGFPTPPNPYADVQDLMKQYPGVDPNELRRYKKQTEQARLDEAADRFRRDSANVAPQYEKNRRAANEASAEAFAQKNEAQYGYRPQGSPGGSTFRPGMAQPIQPQSRGTPYQYNMAGGGMLRPGNGSDFWEDAGPTEENPYEVDWGGAITAEDAKHVIGGPGRTQTVADWKQSQQRIQQRQAGIASIRDEFPGIDDAMAARILDQRETQRNADGAARATRELQQGMGDQFGRGRPSPGNAQPPALPLRDGMRGAPSGQSGPPARTYDWAKGGVQLMGAGGMKPPPDFAIRTPQLLGPRSSPQDGPEFAPLPYERFTGTKGPSPLSQLASPPPSGGGVASPKSHFTQNLTMAPTSGYSPSPAPWQPPRPEVPADWWMPPAPPGWGGSQPQGGQAPRPQFPQQAQVDPAAKANWAQKHQQAIASPANQKWLKSLSPANRKAYGLMQGMY